MKCVAIVGVGLIGGSCALGLKRAFPDVKIIGSDASQFALSDALRIGAIDAAAPLLGLEEHSPDVVLIAVPVRAMSDVFAELAVNVSAQTVLMDVGSTKADVIRTATQALGERAHQFVAAHPIAGREHAGVEAAEADLFVGKKVVLIADDGDELATSNRVRPLATARAFWRALGATTVTMSAQDHDRIFAAVSHLPHLLAFALVDELASRSDARQFFEHAASGFRDFTRIASSSPPMWRDISINNRDAILQELDRYRLRLESLRGMLVDSDQVGLEALMTRARSARNSWLSGELGSFRDENV